MKQLISSTILSWVCTLAFLTLWYATPAAASETKELLRENFTGGKIPATWTGNFNQYGWVYSSTSIGGENGSAATQLYKSTGSTPTALTTPAINAAIYNKYGDTVIVEFDYYIEEGSTDYNNRKIGYDAIYERHTITVFAKSLGNTLSLKQLNTYTDYTEATFTSTYRGSSGSPKPNSDGKMWRHAILGIPLDYRNADLTLSFSAKLGGNYTAGTIAIDNLVITGTRLDRLTPSDKSINFGFISQYNRSGVASVFFTNESNRPITMSNIILSGSSEFRLENTVPSVVAPGATVSIDASFAPIEKGFRSAIITYSTDADIPATGIISLRGEGLMPEASVAAFAYRSTRTKFNTAHIVSVPVTNVGRAPLTIYNSTYLSGDYPEEYSIVRLPQQPIAPNATDSIVISFIPRGEGARFAVLNVASNAINGMQQSQLRGIGVLPRIAATPTVIQFDSVNIGEVKCATLNITNPGTDTLILKDYLFTVADPDFTVTPSVGLDRVLAPGDSRTFNVCFKPVRNGSRVAKLLFKTNIPLTFDAPLRDTSDMLVIISGTGVPHGILAAQATYDIDSTLVLTESCQQATLTNHGQESITISSLGINGTEASEFEVHDLTLPLTLKAGETYPFTLCTTPKARGLRKASIFFNGTTNSKEVTGILPVAVYGQLACAEPNTTSLFTSTTTLGTTDTQTVTVMNCGDIDQEFTASVTGSNYTIIGNTVSGRVAPGGSAQFKIAYTPTSCGASSETLTFTASNIAPITVLLNGRAEGAAISATIPAKITTSSTGETKDFTITITNNSNVNWAPGAPILTGPFTLVDNLPVNIAPQSSVTLTLRFTPTQGGISTGTLSFPTAIPAECATTLFALNGEVATAGVRTVAQNGYSLAQNYPNPFNPSTTIRFMAPVEAPVRIVLTNTKGEMIRTVFEGNVHQGEQAITVDASDLASGTYFYTLYSGTTTLTRQMTLIK